LLNDCKLLKKPPPQENCLSEGRAFLYGPHHFTINCPTLGQFSEVLETQDTKKFGVQLELLCPLPFKWVQRLEETYANYKQ
jgi:hypothetical protein